MRSILSVLTLLLFMFSSAAQKPNETEKELKQLLEKSKDIQQEETMFSLKGTYSDMKVSFNPCSMKYTYTHSYETSQGPGKSKHSVEIKWENVGDIRENIFPNMISISSNSNYFDEFIYRGKEEKKTGSTNSVDIAVNFLLPDGTVDKARVDRVKELLKKMVADCGGKLKP